MAFCKICTCGEKIVVARRLSFPDNCPSCGRRLIDFMVYDENDPQVEKLMNSAAAAAESVEESTPATAAASAAAQKQTYALKLSNGSVINIPSEGCIIGRTETGAEELAAFPSVSRQHLKVTVRRNIGVIIEDISSYGTLVDGQRIAKNSPVAVAEGAKITLCNLEAVLIADRGDVL